MSQEAPPEKRTLNVPAAASIGILFGVVISLAIMFIAPILSRLMAARSLDELLWISVDVVRGAETWLYGLGRYAYEPGYNVRRIATSPIGLSLIVAVFCAIHLLCFSRKRS